MANWSANECLKNMMKLEAIQEAWSWAASPTVATSQNVFLVYCSIALQPTSTPAFTFTFTACHVTQFKTNELLQGWDEKRVAMRERHHEARCWGEVT